MRHALCGVALAVLPVLVPTSGVAQSTDLVTATPDAVLTAFADQGYLLRLTQDNTGDPMLRGKINGKTFVVLFYDCQDSTCKSVTFKAWFTTAQPVSLGHINNWNKGKRFGKAYIDEDADTVLEMEVNLDFGVSASNLSDTADWWRVVLNDFKTFLEDT
ncbi:MAG: YbjN domain-containing protein [Paracoccaceae bacterium]